MKKLVVSKEQPCKACLSCVIACSQAFYKKFDPDLSCIRITAKPDGEPKVNNCIMCGKCARTCPEQAISQNAKGVYMVDKKKCVGCGKCVEACPMHVMVLAPGATTVSKCIACGICERTCKYGAIHLVNNVPVIDYSKCVGCKECMNKCPRKVIKERNA